MATSPPAPDVPPARRIPDRIHRRRWAILTLLMLSLLIVVLDNSILNVAMKTIATPAPVGLGATQSELEWAINSYTLVFAGLLFTAGLLGDRLGRKKTLLFGLAVFGAGSVLAGVSGSPTELITFRALMGVGGAFVMPSNLAILMNVFEREEQPKAIGIWAGGVGVAIAVGPIAGGLLLDHFWWGSVFMINAPIVVLSLIAMLVLVPDSKDPRPGRLDPFGVLLSIVGLVLLVYGIIKGGQLADFTEPEVVGPIAGGLLVLAVFVVHQKRSDHPSIDIGYFRNRAFSAAITAIALVFFALTGVTFFIVFYVQSVRGYSPLQAGMLILPLAAAQLIFAPRARLAVDHYGARAVCTFSMFVVANTMVGLLLLDADTPLWLMEALFFIQGSAMAHIMPPATVAVMQALPREKAGSGSALNNVFRQVGGTLGVAVLGSLLSTSYRDHIQGTLDALPGVPAAVRHAAGESIEATLSLAARMGPDGRPLTAAADDAFIHAMHITALGSAVVAMLGTVVSAAFLPGKMVSAPQPAEPHEERKAGVQR